MILGWATVGLAQQSELTLMHLYNSVPQANQLNAALFPDYKFTMSMPGMGAHFVYLNNNFLPFSYFVDNTDPETGLLTIDATDFNDQLRNVSRVEAGYNANLFHLGWRFPTTYWSIGTNFRNSNGVSIPGSMMSLLLVGNQNIDTAGLDLRQFSMRSTAFTEYYLTFGWEVTPDLSLAVRGKLLSGLYHVGLDRIGAQFQLGADGYSMVLEDFTYRSAGLAGAVSKEGVSLIQTAVDGQEPDLQGLLPTDINGYLSFLNNTGVAVDFGAQYRLRKFLFHGGFNDIGFINWNAQNTYQVQFTEAEFNFDGLDLSGLLEDPNQAQDPTGLLDGIDVDSLLNSYQPQFVEGEAYRTSLSGRFYLGAYYDLADWHRVGILSYNTLVNWRLFPALSVAYNVRLKRILDLAVSTSLVGGAINNVGLGANLNLGAFHVYAVTDNVLPVFGPRTLQNVNFRTGINFNFGVVGAKRARLRKQQDADENDDSLDFLDDDTGAGLLR
ncbi:MAG TPA: hypothetical protein DCR93_32330 [Cytophagales bacterium]|nr:hypothetical protein [Cytophagales bacterium]HAP63981.1 hypothetical protein [Cytophagales bacterium]